MKTLLSGIESAIGPAKYFLCRSIRGNKLDKKMRFLKNLIKDVVFNHIKL